jgi:hypothetical protein
MCEKIFKEAWRQHLKLSKVITVGLLSYYFRTKLWNEIDRLDDKVDFLMRRVQTLEAKLENNGIK